MVSFLSDRKRPIKVDLQAAKIQDQGDPSQMKSVVRESILRRPMDGQGADSATKKYVQTMKTEPVDVLPKKQRDELQDLRDAIDPTKKGKDKDRLTVLEDTLDRLSKQELWRLQQGIKKPAAEESLRKIDPQMVIEAILSREWGNCNEKAKWRRGRQDLVNRLATMLPGGFVPFASYHLPKNVMKAVNDFQQPPSAVRQGAPTKPTDQEKFERKVGVLLAGALKKGQSDFASVERLLYEEIRTDTKNRPGSPPLRPEVEDMIERMREFTRHRLKMDSHYYRVLAGSISHSSGIKLSDGPTLPQTRR